MGRRLSELCESLRQRQARHKWTPILYLKMKVLGAIDIAPGKTRDQRVRSVAEMTFLDESCVMANSSWRRTPIR